MYLHVRDSLHTDTRTLLGMSGFLVLSTVLRLGMRQALPDLPDLASSLRQIHNNKHDGDGLC